MEDGTLPKGVAWFFGFIAALILFTILFFVFCFRTVGVGQVGLVTRFGSVVREQPSGVVVKLPWPIEHLTKLNIQTQKEQASAAAATSDLQDVTTTLALNYHIDPNHVKDLYTNVGVDYKVRIIDPAIQEAFKATSAQYDANGLLNKRPEVKAKALDVLKARLEKHFIIVDDLSIIDLQFSPQFSKAIEDKQAAQQSAQQAAYDVEKAQNQAKAAIAAAEGQAEAQRLLQSTATPLVLEKLAIDKWDGKLPTYIGQGTVFNIPLQGQ